MSVAALHIHLRHFIGFIARCSQGVIWIHKAWFGNSADFAAVTRFDNELPVKHNNIGQERIHQFSFVVLLQQTIC